MICGGMEGGGGVGPTSSISDMVLHSAYQRIIGVGVEVLPLIMKELQDDPDHWFWALHSITEDDPVPEESRGNLAEMTEAWLAWGLIHGYVFH